MPCSLVDIYTDVSEGCITLKTAGAYLKRWSKYGDYCFCWAVMPCSLVDVYTDVSEGSIALKTEGAYSKLRSKYEDYCLLGCDAV
jgi:hypothetical protein